jgi:hypothetical protein
MCPHEDQEVLLGGLVRELKGELRLAWLSWWDLLDGFYDLNEVGWPDIVVCWGGCGWVIPFGFGNQNNQS